MIEGVYIVPRDTFTGVCKEMAELADLMLKLAIAMTKEQQLFAEDSQAIKHAMKATAQLRYIETLMRAIVEGNKPPEPVNGSDLGGGGEPDDGGGAACAGS